MDAHDWLLKRNCSLAPRQLGLAYALLCLASLLTATPFLLLHGAWLVLLFAVLEMAGVALAFLHYARHATDREHVALRDGWLLVERELGMRTEQLRLDPRRARVVDGGKEGGLVRIEADGVGIQLGRFVTAARRRRFAEELRGALRQAAFASPLRQDTPRLPDAWPGKREQNP